MTKSSWTTVRKNVYARSSPAVSLSCISPRALTPFCHDLGFCSSETVALNAPIELFMRNFRYGCVADDSTKPPLNAHRIRPAEASSCGQVGTRQVPSASVSARRYLVRLCPRLHQIRVPLTVGSGFSTSLPLEPLS